MIKNIKLHPSFWGLGSSMPFLIRVIRRFIWLFHNFNKPRKQSLRILLPARSILMLKYELDIYKILNKNEHISFFITCVDPPFVSKEIIYYCRNHDLNYINPIIASMKYWDLIVFADHDCANNFSKSIKKLFVYHAFGFSKIIKQTGETHKYARTFTLRKDGKPMYDCIFESSQKRFEKISISRPELVNKIAVVGDIHMDELISMGKKRSQIRDSMSINDTEVVVLIGSTFGTESLMESIGIELIEAAKSLQNRYRFIISTHPHHWNPEHDSPDYNKVLISYKDEGFIIHEQPSDFRPYIIASDIVLTDFGSLCLSAALLNKAIGFIDFPDGIISKESYVSQIRDISPILYNTKELSDFLSHISLNSDNRYAKINNEINSFPGEASNLIQIELNKLLNLHI